MKTTYYFVLLLVLTCACSSANNQKGMIKIATLDKEVALKVGQKAYINMSIHGSVGVNAEVYSNDEEIFKLVDTQFKYDNESKSDMPGGDGGTETYIFEALKEGTTTLQVIEEFRGEVTQESNITIVVMK